MSARRWLLTCLGLVSCARTHFESGGVRYAIDRSACCAVPADTDLEGAVAACEARGCAWQAELLCMGAPFPDDESESEYRTSAERCERRCACVCTEDVEACASTP